MALNIMSDTIIVALITAISAILGQWIIARKNSDELYSKLDKQSELADEKIQGQIDVIKAEIMQLKKAVEKHNNLVERTYNLEKEASLHSQAIEANKREIKEIKQQMHIGNNE